MGNDSLPVIDFAGTSDEVLARQLDQAFTTIGFCYFKGIGVAPALVDGVFEASRRFHAQPRAAKDAIAMNKFHRGYMAPKTSVIQTSSVARVTRPNDSESFMWMHDVPESDPRHGRPLDGPNLWPDLAGFREPVEAYEKAMQAFCQRLLGPLALALGLPRDWFAPYFRQPTLFLRLLHYPPVTEQSPHVRAGAHEDINVITLLLGAEEAGLEILDRDGRWLQVSPPPGAVVCNIGDMLQRLTNHELPSTTHRVVNPAPERRGVSRYSTPFFLHFAPDFEIRTLPGCCTAERPDRYPAPPGIHSADRGRHGDGDGARAGGRAHL